MDELLRGIKGQIYNLIINSGIEEIEEFDRPEDFEFDQEATQIIGAFQ